MPRCVVRVCVCVCMCVYVCGCVCMCMCVYVCVCCPRLSQGYPRGEARMQPSLCCLGFREEAPGRIAEVIVCPNQSSILHALENVLPTRSRQKA